MKGLKEFAKKTVSISLSALLAVSMMPVPAYATIIYDSGDNNYGEEVNDSIEVDASENDVTVTGGDINAPESKYGYNALGINVEDDNTAKVTTGSITSADGSAIHINNYPYDGESGGTADLTVNGDVAGNGTVSVGVGQIMGEGTSKIAINGDVSSEWRGVSSQTRDGESDITINGDVSSETGIYSTSSDDAVSEITVNGDVDSEWKGVEANAYERALTEVTVNGNINSEDTGISSCTYSEGKVKVTVNGDVNGKETGIYGLANTGGETDIEVNGNITSDGIGIYAKPFVFEDEEREFGKVSILAEGTVTGGIIGVGLAEDPESRANVIVTAWKITPNKDGAVAGYFEEDDESEEKLPIEDENFEKNNINYIIRVEQPSEGASLTASADTAHEGETVTLMIDLDDRYLILGAFSDEGKSIPLEQDASGKYYIEVPRGGGVLLSVTVGEILEPKQNKDEDSSRSSDPVVAPVVPAASVSTGSAFAVTQEGAAQAIASVEQGGTVNVVLTEGTVLDKAIVDSLKARPDVTLTIEFVVNGIRYRAVIPAGFDLSPYLNAVGGIDFETLIAHLASIMQ